MLKYNKFESKNLNKKQIETLNTLLNLIIPPSEDGKMPGAADIGFLAYIDNNNILSWTQEGLFNIVDESHNKYGKEFSKLKNSDQMKLIDSLRSKFSKFFNRLTTEVIQCYYQHDDVLEAIGLEARPPFPKGHILEEGDLTLLEAVYLRGKIYRD